MINNGMFTKLVEKIYNDYESFKMLLKEDNSLDLNTNVREIINFLEFTNSPKLLNGHIESHIIITEGDILSILKIVHDLVDYKGDYTIYINGDNAATITYLVAKSQEIYNAFNIDIVLTIDYSLNYNKYLNKKVDLIGSDDFVNTAKNDFDDANLILV